MSHRLHGSHGFFKSHRSHRSHRFFLLSRRNKGNKGNYLNSILSDDTFMFYLNHSESTLSRCFRENINLCSQEQSSLSKRLSSDRILPLLIRVNSWLIRGNSCSKIKISVKICETLDQDRRHFCYFFYFCGTF